MTATPVFSDRSSLARYIHPNHRMRGNRAASVAFFADAGPPRETYLSVNSLEVEKLGAVANYYRKKFSETGKVAVIVKTVGRINVAARSASVALTRGASGEHQFSDKGKAEPAYKHRPVVGKVTLQSLSHSGVEFIRVLEGAAESKFATALVKEKYQEL